MADAAPGGSRSGVLWAAVYTAVYVALAAASLSTNYVASNTATLWMPTGFALGLVVCRGLHTWPAVAVGAFLVNLAVNILLPPGLPLGHDVAGALAVSLGNTFEVLAGGWLVLRYCRGSAFLDTSRGVVGMALVALLAPIPSAAIGGLSSVLVGLTTFAHLPEMIWTWYTADTSGMIIFTAPTVLLLSRPQPLRRPNLRPEAVVLAALLVFLGQAISGITLAPVVVDLPRTYMVIPLLIWASIRFGTSGAVLASLSLALIALLGTVRGYQAFPAQTPAGSLLELQIFLSLVSTLNLYAAASRREVARLQADLRGKLESRTLEVEKLLDDRDLRFGLLAHEIKGPVSSIRMVLNALRDAIERGTSRPDDLRAIVHSLEDASGDLLAHVQGTLADIERKTSGAAPVRDVLDIVMRRIARGRGEAAAATVRVSSTGRGFVDQASLVTLILASLIDNALTHGASARGVDVRVAADRAAMLSFEVRDYGVGVPASRAARLFSHVAAVSDVPQASGMGLLLAGRITRSLGGDVRFVPTAGAGTTVRLELPAATTATKDAGPATTPEIVPPILR